MDVSPPLKPAVFHILLALAEGEKHGYAVMQTVRRLSGGQIPLQTGSFYRHLGRLIDSGLVGAAKARPVDDDPRRGAYYRLTPRGRDVLAAEKDRLRDLIGGVALRPSRKESRT